MRLFRAIFKLCASSYHYRKTSIQCSSISERKYKRMRNFFDKTIFGRRKGAFSRQQRARTLLRRQQNALSEKLIRFAYGKVFGRRRKVCLLKCNRGRYRNVPYIHFLSHKRYLKISGMNTAWCHKIRLKAVALFRFNLNKEESLDVSVGWKKKDHPFSIRIQPARIEFLEKVHSVFVSIFPTFSFYAMCFFLKTPCGLWPSEAEKQLSLEQRENVS